MTKADLVERLVDRTGIARSTAIKATDAIIRIIASTLADAETISLRGLGTFKVRTSNRKTARNISAGTTITLPPRKTVKFIPGQKIKTALK
ncbi:MAG: integration host factor subunit beta [Muribaculaceae bacterium]|nr:integration host factor subunit beta [Muribaculaceae bacterium]